MPMAATSALPLVSLPLWPVPLWTVTRRGMAPPAIEPSELASAMMRSLRTARPAPSFHNLAAAMPSVQSTSSTARMRSPACNPALDAGELGSTAVTLLNSFTVMPTISFGFSCSVRLFSSPTHVLDRWNMLAREPDLGSQGRTLSAWTWNWEPAPKNWTTYMFVAGSKASTTARFSSPPLRVTRTVLPTCGPAGRTLSAVADTRIPVPSRRML